MNKRWFRTLFRRRILISLLIVLQAALVVWFIVSTSQVSVVVRHILHIISFVAVLAIVAKKDKGAFKTTWVFLILSLPVLGGLMYILMHIQSPTRKMKTELKKAEEKAAGLYAYPGTDYAAAETEMAEHFPQVRYLQNYVGFPVYGNTATKYFSPGEDMLEALLPELEKAKEYIFLEFFIVQEGVMWNSILEILKRKAVLGVTVRVLYDDIGCMSTLPGDYCRTLRSFGIEAVPFSRLRGSADSEFNNRSHRKILVIDGKIGYTGGVNIADEYINERVRFGHWKDTAIRLEGEAVHELTRLFLSDYGINVKTLPEDKLELYPKMPDISAQGYVIPFGDGPKPLYEHSVGKSVIQNMLAAATRYVYMTTPYLIIDNDLAQSIENAALRGVDVRIIVPHIPDKRLVFEMTRSFYHRLMRSGVRIYEYTPGFIHAKSYIADGEYAMIGTINLDYRSLVHHFENGVWMYKCDSIQELHRDILDTLEASEEITEDKLKTGLVNRFVRAVVRIFAPML